MNQSNSELTGVLDNHVAIVTRVSSGIGRETALRGAKDTVGASRHGRGISQSYSFLRGDQCSYITGHMLVVDGGLTITF